MKPRLPHRLIQALLTTCAAALSSTPAFADVPEGYTPVTITGASQLSSYKKTDYIAFLIGVDITDSAYRMTGKHQYWSSGALDSPVSLSFSDLSTSSEAGAAISAAKSLTMEFVNLSFNKNYNKAQGTYSYEPSAYGGAIYGSSSSTISISNSGSVDFSGNYAYSTASYASSNLAYSYGGAIYIGSSSTLTMSNSESLSFNGNYVFSAPASTSSAYSYGGAICGENSSAIAIENNGNVSFIENYASAAGAAASLSSSSYSFGGAIYTTGSLFVTGNDKVTFRGNYERDQGGTYCLRSVYVTGSTLNLAAGEGQNITFYDTLRGGTTTVSFNADYIDKGNVLQKATGDILFSGAHAAEDLTALKANYTQEELTDSLTTRVSATTNLYGGRLRVEDGAIYKGNGINVAAGSGATLRLDNGTLNQAGYSVEMNAGTTLDLQRVNSIAATTLDMKDGSALSFTLGEENLTTAALTLTGALNQGGALTIGLVDDGTMEHENKYALLTMSSGTTPETWDATKLTVEGLVAKASNLSWENGTLYYTYAIPELETATWSGGQSRVWNTTDKNWTQGGYSYAYKDGVDVVFGDTGSGSVSFEGTLAPKSVLVENTADHDYVWEGGGKLSGETSLTKNGEGKLTINTANDYTGGTVLNGGTLVAGNAKAFGTGTIRITGGELDLGGLSIANAVSAENADVVIQNGKLEGSFAVNGGSVTADALCVETQDVSIMDASRVSFSNANTSYGVISGGIFGSCVIKLTSNDNVSFVGNTSSQGGAINASIYLTGNNQVLFHGNSASSHGGAILGEVNCTENGRVEFIENTAAYGGALFASSVFESNDYVIFRNNSSTDGGAICGGSECFITLADNVHVEFSGNSSASGFEGGGAIDIDMYSAINVTGNTSVSFKNNFSNSFGGAVYAHNQSTTINFSGNENVEFKGNHTESQGGAMYIEGDSSTLTIAGNGHVEFRGNYEQLGSSVSDTHYYLRSVYMHNWIGQMEIDEYEYMQNPEYYDSFRSNLNISAGDGQDVVFYDSLYVSKGTNVYFNAESGATGDIVFSGKHAAEDLEALKENYHAWELEESLTTEVYNTTYLYNGRMSVEDGAIYKGDGIEVGTWMAANATLRLANGTLDQAGYGIYMYTGSTLALEGVNSITAPELILSRNSILEVTLGSVNAETALLTLYGDFVWSEQLSVDVSYDEAAAAVSPLRIFDTCREGVPEGWTEQNVSVSGTTFDKLQWSEGILYLNLTGGDIPLLPSLEWAGGDMRWNSTSANWLASGFPAAYSDNAKVHFGDVGAGTVMLSGTLAPRSVEVENTTGHDYTFQGGCLTGGMHLTKSGEGVLTVKSANSYMGGTVLNAGTLVAGSPEAFGTGTIQINGGTLDLGSHSIGNDIAIAKGANFTIRNGCLNHDLEIVGGSMVADGLHLDTQNLSIKNADSVVFRNANSELSPYSYDGGAIQGDDLFCSIEFSGNGSMEFSGNRTDGNGGAIHVASEYGTINIANNGNVTFSGNTAYNGAAIYAEAYTLNIANNDHVEFRGNYETGTGQLRSMYLPRFEHGATNLSLVAGANQDIVFFDTLYVEDGAVELNNWEHANGDIVFSGKYAKEDLAAWKPNYTEQELSNSLTSELYTTTYLYGGRLRVEDGAILKGCGISVYSWDSLPSLRLAGGTLDQAEYDITLETNAALDLVGVNNITASALKMLDGSTLSFNMGAQEGALLNLDAALETGVITISVNGDLEDAHDLISLADVAQYDTALWTEQSITVQGTDFKHLVWSNGVLSYTGMIKSHIDLDADSEKEDFGDAEAVDIEGNGHSLTVKHPVDLVHLAMKDGVVKLEGEENNVVRITLTEDGTLQLAAGAGLNVGNIVSMVANGSADLVISGDIEISDIKAYGKPGNKGTLSYVNMTTAGDYTIENMSISGSVIDVGEGTTLYLVNVDIKADTHITDDPAQVFVQGTHIQLDKTNTWVDKEIITAAQDTLLYMCGDTRRAITLAAGSEIVELTSSMFDSVTLTGTDLWLDMTGIAEATYGKDYFTLDFQDFAREMAKAQVDVENLHVYATLDGESYTEAYSTASGGLTTTLYFQVPEPTSSTLSLLALAGLAARRRRK